jgi:hypothetical protein
MARREPKGNSQGILTHHKVLWYDGGHTFEDTNMKVFVKISIVLCVAGSLIIAVEAWDTISFIRNGVTAEGTVMNIVLKRMGPRSTGSTHGGTPSSYPEIRFIDHEGNPHIFESSYSCEECAVGDLVPVRYLPGNPYRMRMDIFTVNWFFSICAVIMILVCGVGGTIARMIVRNQEQREAYRRTLTGKIQATVTGVVARHNGWDIILEGKIPEKGMELHRFSSFTYTESEYLIGKQYEVNYDPADVEGSYMVEIVHILE